MTEIIPVSDVRSRFLKLIRQIERVPDRFIVTRDGQPKAVLLSYEEFRSWLATLEVMLDPGLAKGILEGLRDRKAGRLRSFEDIFDEPL